VIGLLPAENPDQHICPEIGPEKNNPGYPLIEEKQNGAEKKEGNGIGNQMVQTAVQQGRCEDANQSYWRPGNDPEKAQWPSIQKFNIKGCPH
jgi:hypothetical protein